MFNKKSLKCIESQCLGHYQVHIHRFFCVQTLLLDLGII